MRYVRIILKGLAYTLVIAAIIGGGAAAVLTLTEAGRTRLAGIASSLASDEGRTVEISGLEGIVSGNLRVRQVIVSDDQGPWLALRGVELDWSPLALFGFSFDAERLHAARIELARLPQAGETGEAGGGFSLLVTVSVNAIDLPDIAIGSGIAGEVARIGAAGSLVIDNAPMRVDARLTADRRDGRDGSLDAVIAYEPDRDRIELDVDVTEPAGGVMAGLMGLAGSPAVALSLDGEGPLADWNGTGRLTLDGTEVTRLTARHQLVEGGRRVELQGSGDFQPFLPEAFRPLARGETDLTLAALVGDGGTIGIDNAEISTEALAAQARGTYSPDGMNDMSLTAQARNDSVTVALPLAGTDAQIVFQSGEIRLLGPADAAALNGEFVLPRLAYGDYQAEDVRAVLSSEAFDVAAQTGEVAVRLDAGAAGSANETIASLLAGAVTAAGNIGIGHDEIRFANVEARTGTLLAAVDGRFGRTDGALTAQLSGDVSANALPAASRRFLEDRVAFSGEITRTGAGALGVSNLAVSSGSLEIGGEVELPGDTVSATLNGRIGDLARLSQGARGQATFSLSAQGPMDRPDVNAAIRSEEAVLAGRAVRDLSIVAEGVADMAAPSAQLTLGGRIGEDELSGGARLSSGEGRSQVEDLAISLGDNRLEGALDLGADFVPAGTITFDFPDIAPLAALGLVEAQGAGAGRIELSSGERPSLRLNSDLTRVGFGELSAQGIRIEASVDNYLDAPGAAGRIEAASIASGQNGARDIVLVLTQDGDWTGFDARATANDIPASATGRVMVSGGDVTAELATLRASLRGIVAELARPTTIRYADGVAQLQELAISAGGGTVTTTGTAGADQLNLNVRLASLPVQLANAFSPGLDAAGTLSGTARVTGAPASPSVSYDVALQNGALAQTRAAGFGAVRVDSTGTFSAGRLQFRANIGEASGIGLDGGGNVDINSRRLDVNFSGSVPFGFLTQRLAAQGLVLNGTADVSIAASGAMTAPALSGSVRANGARLVHAPSGIAIDSLSADIGLGNNRATINALSGTLSTGGSLSGSGFVGIDAAAGFPADLSFTVQEGRYTDGQIVTANFGGTVTVTGALTGSPVLGGVVDLGRTIITVPERLPGGLARLDVEHRNAPADVRRQEEALRPASGGGGSGGGGLTLDVQVNAPQQIFVRGRGLDAELGGNIRLTGPVAAPEAVGLFTLRRGRLEVLTRRLSFTRGTAGFSGSLIPYLDMEATSDMTDASVTVRVTGPANNPAFSFDSSPALPEDEILARLVFGRAMGSLSALQIAQLASAAATLAGVGGSTSLLDTLRDATGLDDIDIRTDEETGDTSVAVGRYLNDRTYLTIEQGSQPSSGRAAIDLEVGRGIKLRGEARGTGETRGGIFYEREY